MLNLHLRSPVGRDEVNDIDDIASTGTALVDLGLDAAGDAAQTGTWDDEFDSTIRAYQERNGLDVDGILLPGGPTETAINTALRKKLVRPRGEATSDIVPEPSISDSASKALAEGQRLNSIGQVIAAFSRAERPESGIRDTDEQEKLARLGYRYRPDPMGRIGWGEWLDASGGVADPTKLDGIASQPKRAAATASAMSLSEVAAGAEAQTTLEQEIARLDRLPLAQRRASKIRLALPLDAATVDFRAVEGMIDSTNAAIAQATVRDALNGRRIQLRDVADLLKAPVSQASGHRIRDILMDAAYSNSSAPGKRNNARAMLAVHDDAMREAFSQRLPNPEQFGDRVLVNYLAADAGDVAWRISVPDQDEGDAGSTPGGYAPEFDVDEGGVDPATDDQAGKPRGSRNPITREKAAEGRQAHREFTDRHRPREVTEGWDIDRVAKGLDGKNYRPDARKAGKIVVEVKPDTESGRRAGQQAKEKYRRAFDERVRILYHKGPKGGSGPSSGGTAPTGGSPSSSNSSSGAGRASAPERRRVGVGSTRVPLTKGFAPPVFSTWPPRRN